MLILGIESSCDDTSVALLNCSDEGHVIIAEKTASQIDVHKKYGGVVPEIAGRMHAEIIVPLVEDVLSTQQHNNTTTQHHRPDVIAVTAGPGLITGLIVGVEAARTLSYAWNIPLVGVNHIAGHIHSVEISNDKCQMTNQIQKSNTKNDPPTPYSLQPTTFIQLPALALVVSGGHTELILMPSHTNFTILGATKDDAAGECFDKVAKLLGLPYPGGPQISKLAATGRTDAIAFPRPMLKEKGNFSAKGGPAYGWDFSFAGLKTSALYWLRDHSLVIPTTFDKLNVNSVEESRSVGESDSSVVPTKSGLTQNDNGGTTLNDFCASFEQAIVDVLVAKTLRAAEEVKPKTIILAGGVAANKKLRQTLTEAVNKITPYSLLLTPSPTYCMDNGAMIAVAGYYQALKKNFTPWDKLAANPNWKVDEKKY